jgi:hypothetical protein
MAPGSKSIVFRVTGFPAGRTDDQLTERLISVIKENFREEERGRVAKVVLVPSCQNDGETSVALVEFVGDIPHFLSGLAENPLADLSLEMDDTDITFDRHFFGFTQLYATEPGEPVVAE